MCSMGEMVNFPWRMDSCLCGILQIPQEVSALKDEKKIFVLPPLIPQANNYPVYTDPFGSYTGRSLDMEKPVQDADDL